MPMPLSGLAQTLSNSVAKVQAEIVDVQEQLSAGVKTLSPAQNGVVTRLSAQATAYSQVVSNITTAQSVIDVGAGTLVSIASILTKMKELATQAASSGLTTSDTSSLNTTFSNLASQISTLQNGASVNGNNLLNNTAISVTTGIDGSNSAQTSVSGVDVSTIASTAQALNVTLTASTANATVVQQGSAGVLGTSGVAAVDKFVIGAAGAGKTVTMH